MKRELKKYRSIFSLGIQDALSHRGELALWSVIDAIPLLAMLVLWVSAFRGRAEIAGYTQATLIAYYIIGYIISDLTGAYFEEDVLDEIRFGTISGKLTKPISVKKSLVVRELSWRVATLITSAGPVAILAFLLAKDIMPAPKLTHLFTLTPFLILAYLTESVLSLMVVAMGFVFEEAKSLRHLKWMLGWLFSGGMMPLEFMPGWLASLASLLPFKFRYYVPIQIFLGNIKGNQLIFQFAIQAFWLVGLITLMRLLWSRNLKQFTAVGG